MGRRSNPSPGDVSLDGRDDGSSTSAVSQQQPREEPRELKWRKVRLHKIVKPVLTGEDASSSASRNKEDAERTAAMDRRIAELIPGLADLNVSSANASAPKAMQIASEIRAKQLARRQEAHRAESVELANIYDMSLPNPVETTKIPPPGEWEQELRPRVRKVNLSSYQFEMINYQRMILKRNVWYYRDRMSVPRGPCPLHVLKDAWVQGMVDENTLMWGRGLVDWLPAKNIKLLLPLVRTPEVKLGAWMKRTFSLKPALNRIREQRKEHRNPEDGRSQQVEYMR